MIKSMTGFGRAECISERHKFTVEIKSVNQKYCEMAVKVSKKLIAFEPIVRNILKEYVGRGRIDVFIFYEEYTDNAISVRFNEGLARQYYEQLSNLSKELGIENDITVSKLALYPDVFTLEENSVDEESMRPYLEHTVREAAERFIDARSKEGVALYNDIQKKLVTVEEIINHIEVRYPKILLEYRNRLTAKVQELLSESTVDEARVATEIVMYADKICIDEEVVRLKSHVIHLKDTLEEVGSIGKKLDFIIQELNRESNTILSKNTDVELSNQALALKAEIEKMREQVQNIE